MRPAHFALHRPTSVSQALSLKAEYGEKAAFHAGGTELLVALKSRVLRYEHLIDIKQLRELHGIRLRPDGTLSIGALSTHHCIANSRLVHEHLPSYAELSEQVANIRVRVAGTIGGVLCFGEPHADAPTMLCALDAWVVLAGPSGERELPLREFHLGEFSTARRDDELLVSIEVAPQSAGTRSAYRCFGQSERPAVGVAAVWSIDNPHPLSLWAGAVAGIPVSLAQAEEAARTVSRTLPCSALWEALRPAVEADAARLDVRDDLHGGAEYKRHLVCVLAQRALEACVP